MTLLVRILTRCIIMHLMGLDLMPHIFAHLTKRSVRILKFYCVLYICNLAVAETIIRTQMNFRICVIHWYIRRAIRDPGQCQTKHVSSPTKHHRQVHFAAYTTETNRSKKSFAPYVIPKQLAFEKMMSRGIKCLFEVQYKSTCPPLSKI